MKKSEGPLDREEIGGETHPQLETEARESPKKEGGKESESLLPSLPSTPEVAPPPSTLATSLPATSEQVVLTEYYATFQLLNSIGKRLGEGNVKGEDEVTYRKLRAEFQMKLHREISNLHSKVSEVEGEKASRIRELQECLANWSIGQVTGDEYGRKKSVLESEIQQIDTRVSLLREQIKKLQELAG
jgi:hypothetical protein